MKLKCPHCRSVSQYDPKQIHIFVECVACGREFRPAATSPVMADQARLFGMPPRNSGKVPTARGISNVEEWASHTRKGMELFHLKRYGEAEEELRKSLSINRNQPQVQRTLRQLHVFNSRIR